jgi:hypothetical protein
MTLLFSTIISCSQAIGIIHRIQKVVGLSEAQKTEIIAEIRKVIPSCPVKIVPNKK